MEETEQHSSEINENLPQNAETNNASSLRQYKWWLHMSIYAFLVLTGQSVATILGRLYFKNGGKSIWIATLVQVVGFPVLFPFQFSTKSKQSLKVPCILIAFYVAIGTFIACISMLFSVGLQYLPVTTITLIFASQLGFNALFSYFINGQRFTPYILNSLVLLTLSSVLLLFQTTPGNSNNESKAKYILGFICTLAASAGAALAFCLTQFAFRKIIKKETVRAVVDMTMYQNLAASICVVIGLFASGDWKKVKREMDEYELGKVSYVMNLFWTSVSWQVFGVGYIGLVFKVSALFCNVVSLLGLPVGPVLAVIFLREKMTGLKAVSMVLAMWGFVSYVYQHYLDHLEIKRDNSGDDDDDDDDEQVSEVALVNERI